MTDPTDRRDAPAERWADTDDGPFDDEWYDEWDPAPDPGDEVGEWVEWREPMSRGKRVLIGLGTLALVLVVAVGAVFVWVQRQIDPPGGPADPVEVEIVAGSTTEDIGSVLADADVITNAAVWNYWTRFTDKGPFQAGDYEFQRNSSFDEAVAVLEAGPEPPESLRITIPEGLTVREISARLADPVDGVAGFSQAVVDAVLTSGEVRSKYQPAEVTSMEGLLFPDTYEIADDADERSVVRRLVTELDTTLDELDVTNRAAALGVTPYDVIIIASLIEEEARVPQDRAKIARVIYNRLEQGIPLGIDATSRYEAELAGRSRDDIDFSSDSPYNSRRVQGLPPTPIAAPGRASFEAALAPEPGTWIFYVLANEQGEHFFTESAREFERAKAECARNNLGCG